MISQSRIIGIGGVSRAGKSFLAKKMADFYTKSGVKVNILDQDNFVFPKDEIPRINGHIDWESPESINFQHLNKLILNSRKSYDVTIVEGILVFCNTDLINLFDYKVFITLPKDEFIKRKREDLRWGKEPEWYIEYIWEMHQNFGQLPQNYHANMVLDGRVIFNTEEILQKIKIPHPHY